MSNYYEILEVERTATEKDIKSAYRKLAKKWHPDTTQFDKDYAAVKFKEITNAYNVLSDAEARKNYDYNLDYEVRQREETRRREQARREAEARRREQARQEAERRRQEQERIWEEERRQQVRDKQAAETRRREQARQEAERRRQEQERQEVERRRQEQERVEAERRCQEQERQEVERRRQEQERQEVERRRQEQERVEAERRRQEQERVEAERRRQEQERQEVERRRWWKKRQEEERRKQALAREEKIKQQKVKNIVEGILMTLLLIAWGLAFWKLHYDEQKAIVLKEMRGKNINKEYNINNFNQIEIKEREGKIIKAIIELRKYGIDHTYDFRIATSYSHNKSGYLLVCNKSEDIDVVDLKNNRGAIVINSNLLSDEKMSVSGELYFDILIKNDIKDDDVKLGRWNKRDHIIPIKVEYRVLADNTIEPGMIKSYYSNDKKYDRYLQEQKNVDLVNLILTELPDLKNDYRKVK